MKRILIFLLVGLAGAVQAEVKFTHGPLAEAVKKAEAEKKPIMIDFLTDWCRWCDTLDRNTYSDARVADFVNSKLVPIKIDAEKGEGVEIAKKYGVRGYPTILLIQADGTEIDRLVGYMPPDPFLKSLGEYVEGTNTIAALKAALEKNPEDMAAQYNMATKYAERNDLASAAPYYEKVLALDPADKAGHAAEAAYALAMNTLRQSKDPAPLAAFAKKHQGTKEAQGALTALMSFSIRQKNGDDAKRYFEQYIEAAPNDAATMNSYAWSCAGQKINLDHAAEAAARAVALTSDGAEKAAYLDTEAAVEFARGGRERAIALQEEAIALLQGATAKERKPYEEALARYKAAPVGLQR